MTLRVVVAVIAGVAACGRPAPPSPSSPRAEATLPDVPFDQLDHEQRAAFMKQTVVPTMAPIFQAHDARGFRDFGCTTCHGKQADAGQFDMPNPDLPHIGKSTMPTFKPEDVAWMAKQVNPAMAKLLGQPEWTSERPQGFGCHGCHVTEE